jgi:hypothetical protein
MRRAATVFLLLLFAECTFAEDAATCRNFAWPIEAEQALLAAAEEVAPLPEGLNRDSGKALVMPLVAFGDAQLAMPPERVPRNADSFAGKLEFAAGAARTYNVTVSANAWIDVVQDGRQLKSTAFTGNAGCKGVRRSVRFEIGAGPFVLQVSDVPVDSIRVVLTPAK